MDPVHPVGWGDIRYCIFLIVQPYVNFPPILILKIKPEKGTILIKRYELRIYFAPKF
jgi:hypothetical protein